MGGKTLGFEFSAHRVNKKMATLIGAGAVSLSLFVMVPAQASSDWIWYNDPGSKYAINVYSGEHCEGTRTILKPGQLASGKVSMRVNYTSWVKVGSGAWVKYIPNRCVTSRVRTQKQVFVGSNLS